MTMTAREAYATGTQDAYDLYESDYTPIPRYRILSMQTMIDEEKGILAPVKLNGHICPSIPAIRDSIKTSKAYWRGFISQVCVRQGTFPPTPTPTPAPIEKKESTMPTVNKTSRTLKAATHGAKVATADKAANNLVLVLEKSIGAAYPEGLKNATGRELVKFFLSAGLLEVNTRNPGILPINSEGINSACELVVDASTRNVVGPLLEKLTPALKKLAAAGKAVEASAAAGNS